VGLSLLTDAPEITLDILMALMAGFSVFGEEIPQRTRVRAGWFVLGAEAYFVLELIAGG
jgi:hypothetical protein